MCGDGGGAGGRARVAFLVLAALDLALTAERQVFDFLGYMWTPILANFLNVLLLIFGCFGAVQRVPKYLLAYSVWALIWLAWNVFLICFFLNVGILNRESDILSLGTGSISWWESNGWGCRPVWGDVDGGNTDGGAWLRPARVDGCLLPWPRVELTQAAVSSVITASACIVAVVLAVKASKTPATNEKVNPTRRPIYTIELSPAETVIGETSLKPMTPRRVKRRSGSRTHSSVRRSRRSYRNAAYHASTASLPRDPRPSRPTSAHSSYSNFHGTRPASYHAPERKEIRTHEQYETQIDPNSYDTRTVATGYDVAGPYDGPTTSGRNYDQSYGRAESRMEEPQAAYSYGAPAPGYMAGEGGWEAPPPPAPPYCARATPQAPGPPAYQPATDGYH